MRPMSMLTYIEGETDLENLVISNQCYMYWRGYSNFQH